MPYPVFDLHCDTADRLAWQSLPHDLLHTLGSTAYGPGDENHLEDIRDIGHNRGHISLEGIGDTPWVQCFACYIPDALTPQQSVAFFRHVSANLEEQAQRHTSAFALASRATDIPSDPQPGHVLGVRTIENARLFAADPDLVGSLADAGVLMASLSWNAPGPLANGHDDEASGLTDLGREVLQRMEEAHMVLDVSHLNDRCFDDVLRLSTRPFVASHSNSRAVCGHPRNLTDAQFCEIRDRGGVVGLNFADIFLNENGSPSFDDISRHIEHWLDLDGEDIVALGSDFDGCDTPPCIAAARDMPSFQEQLTGRFGEQLTRKLCFDNARAFFSRWAR
ncbi:membrane dipeptidase [Collinsella sp. An2]|uniref:dipeptidase n=1 Tax=Collinsella sp. An2 TaxID=1965585 RepID=UPI000B367B23|nr:membrane dipeptidase [Collinsella sp. An2]OUP06824.1 hypothetical protein B5F33_09770 [Collinsella sp. An2]